MESHQHYHHQTNDKKYEHHNIHAGHDHGSMIDDFRRRFWISLALSIPVLIFSPMIQQFLGFSISFPGMEYITAAISTIIFFYGGWPFLAGFVSEVKEQNPGMMTLIALAITVAWAYSTATVFLVQGMSFYWELATLIVIMLLGHWIEMRSIAGASRSLELLAKMMPSDAHLLHGEHIMDVPVSKLKIGDIILVKANEKVPADGTIEEGESYLNESMLTGESKPVKKGKGEEVIGGAINGNHSIKVKVGKTGEDSYLKKVINLVQEAQQSKSKTQNLANKAARWLTFVAIGVGLITLTVWLILGKDFNFALSRMVTVMVISCPHALGLAIPLVVAISTVVSANNGLLIRNRTAFENARNISALIFDKTGTLTEGNFGVSRVQSLSDINEEQLLQWAATLEQHSEHPIAKGVVEKAKEKDLNLMEVIDFESITGKGIKGKIEGNEILVVSPGYLRENEIEIPQEAISDKAETVVFVIKEHKLLGFIALADKIRPESVGAVKVLQEKGIKIYMATGDNEQTAKAVSDKLGLDGYYAEVLPHEKQDIIRELQSQGAFVAMTGDGVNDAPALAQANIGIAVGSGTDVAAETADIILVNSNPKDIVNLILFGRATYSKMVQNLLWATAYNIIAIPLAAGILYPNFMLSPAVGAVFMSLSTVIVAINAQLLKTSLKNEK
ncbi:MAG: cadmium-translocating P-type ATPase [Saprospiraceae bacterium]|nr:cadmium-translocating P-type ATPase [Saprospiraceae bacterium]